jgi:dihydroorotase-like cyclic amidohydrolase
MPKLFDASVIDDQVHFRAGLTHKGDIESESRAVCWNNFIHWTTQHGSNTFKILEDKYQLAAESLMLITHLWWVRLMMEEVLKTNPKMLQESKYFRFF